MTSLALIWDLIAKDQASPAFLRTASAADKAATATARAEGALAKSGAGAAKVAAGMSAAGAKMTKGLTLPLLGIAAVSVKMAGDFQQSTNVLVTAAGESAKNLGLVRKGILDIATATGTKWQEVVDGMYLLEKAGYRGADALKVEKAAAQGAREENASLATVSQALTSIMASYHLKAADAVKVMNQMKTAAGESKTTMEQFAGSLSTVLPLASANKISFADIAGSLASLTQHGTSADEAAQELAFTMRGLSAPNQVAIKEMAQLGLSSIDVSKKLGDGPGGRGLAGTLNYLSKTVLEKMGKTGTVLLSTFNASKVAAHDAQVEFNALAPATQKLAKQFIDGTITSKDWVTSVKQLSPEQANLARQFATTENNAKGFQQAIKNGVAGSQTYSDAIKKMTGGANGLNTTLQLTGESMDGTNERIKRVQAAANGAGKDVSGWASTQKLFNVQLDIMKQKLSAAAIQIGTQLLPIFTKIVNVVSSAVDWFTHLSGTDKKILAWSAGILLALGPIVSMGGKVLGVFTSIASGTLGGAGAAKLAIVGLSGAILGGYAIWKGFSQNARDAKQDIGSLTQAIEADSGALGANTRAAVVNILQRRGMLDDARDLGLSTKTLTDAFLGNKKAMEAVTNAENYGLISKGALYRAGSHLYQNLRDTNGELAKAKIKADEYNTAMGVAKDTSKSLADQTKNTGKEISKPRAVTVITAGAFGSMKSVSIDWNKIATNLEANNPKLKVDSAAAIAGIHTIRDAINALKNQTITIGVYEKLAGITGKGGTASTSTDSHHAAGGVLPEGWATVGERGWEAVYTRNGKSQVFSNPMSQKIMGFAKVPGFADGTTHNYTISGDSTTYESRRAAVNAAHRQLAADLKLEVKINSKDLTSFRNAIKGTADQARSAFQTLVGDVKKAGLAGASVMGVNPRGSNAHMTLLDWLKSENAGLVQEINARNKTLAKMKALAETMRQTVSAIKGAVTGFFDVTQAGASPITGKITGLGVEAQQKQALTNIKLFAADIKKLESRHLNHPYLMQLASQGPSVLPQLQALLSLPSLAGINRTEQQISQIGSSVGSGVANTVYGAQAASLAALERQQAAQARATGRLMAEAVRDGLHGLEDHVDVKVDGKVLLTIVRKAEKQQARR